MSVFESKSLMSERLTTSSKSHIYLLKIANGRSGSMADQGQWKSRANGRAGPMAEQGQW